MKVSVKSDGTVTIDGDGDTLLFNQNGIHVSQPISVEVVNFELMAYIPRKNWRYRVAMCVLGIKPWRSLLPRMSLLLTLLSVLVFPTLFVAFMWLFNLMCYNCLRWW